MITLQNMIFANPQAYQVFPNMVNPYNTGTTELARYTGYLIITDNNGNTHSFTNTSTIDFTTISGLVTIDNVTDRGSVQLGRWRIPQSIIITNDITVTVTPIDEVSSDGATIIPQYEVKYNTYSNGELSESIVVTPDNITLQTNVQWITVDNDQIVVSANTNTEARQGQVIIRVQFQEYSAMANYNIVQAGHDIGQDIMQSMVLWYDLAKQGATNESMAADPKLIDHSGNGHDATCYNFAWVGMSGIGGNRSTIISSNIFTLKGGISTTNGTTIHITHTPTVNSSAAEYVGSIKPGQTIKSCYFRITGLTKGITLIGNSGWESVGTISQDGVYITPEFTNQHSNDRYPNLRFSEESLNKNCDVTIQALGSYPHALVSDGVDDYAMVEGLPILTKEKGFTVIAKRKWISDLNVSLALLYKATDLSFRGAFALEGVIGYGTIKTNYSFGTNNDVEEFESSDITYLTSNSYNGKLIKSGFSEDTDFIEIFRARQLYGSAALYSLLLFNRDLTPEEIEWVKTNLIETEQ